MRKEKKEEWLEAGYRMVAESGFGNLGVEELSRTIGKNKSSFYHYFGELRVFEEELLDRHVGLAVGFAEEIRSCSSIRPGMLEVFLEHRDDLFFHRQLRIGRNDPSRRRAFEKAYERFEEAVMETWSSFLRLQDQQFLAQAFLRLVTENFLLRITRVDFSIDWLDSYMEEVAGILTQLGSGREEV